MTSPAENPPIFTERAATILTTEHWSLLGTRAMRWNESFSRMGLYLNTLSASVVALALVADTARSSFAAFAMVLFPIVFLVGIATFIRLVHINMDDLATVAAMNRLRYAYVQMEPEVGAYLSTAIHDDQAGIWMTNVVGEARHRNPLSMLLVTTPTVLATLNAIVAAAGIAFGASRAGITRVGLAGIATISFAIAWGVLMRIQNRAVNHFFTTHQSRFPTPGS